MPRPWLAAASLIAAIVLSPAVAAGPIQLVKDIDRTLGFGKYGSGVPVAFGASSVGTFCTANTTPSAPRLCNPWISDGTQAGTHVLKHIDVPADKLLGPYATLGSAVYFL